MRNTSLFFSLALCGSLSAQTLIIPAVVDAVTEGNSSTSYPWDRDSATTASNDIRVQNCYDSSNLSSIGMPILITGLRWRANATTASWAGGTYGQVDIRVGDAGVDQAALTTSFDTNWLGGVSPSPAYSGPVTVVPGTGAGTGVPAPWYVSVSLGSPVPYDPASGNDLMIDIAHDGTFSTALGSVAVDFQSTNSLASRMYNITDATAATGSGPFVGSNVVEVIYTPQTGTFANFSVSASNVGPNETVTFTDTTFTSNPGGIVAWDWDFNGDSITDSTLQNPTWSTWACGPNPVRLTVTDASALQSTKTAPINALAPATSFTFTTVVAGPPSILQFNDTSTNGATSWAWDFDGDTVTDSTMQNPQWVYPALGQFNVTLTATNSCGSTMATQTVDTRTLLCTQFGGSVGWTAATETAFYYDVNVLNPAGLTITGLGVQIQSPGVPTTINVYIKQGSHIGSEGERGDWALVSTGSGTGAGTPNETFIDVSDFSLAPGQWAFAIGYTLTGTERLNYTSSGATTASNSDLALSGGTLYAPAFVGTTTFSPRNWNGCIYYDIGQNAGSYWVIGAGCVNSTTDVAGFGLQGGTVPTTGASTVFEISSAPASQPLSFVMFGFSNLGGIDLALIGMPGCSLFPDPTFSFSAPTDAAGVGTASLAIPAGPAAVGLPFWAQGFIVDPGINPFGAVTSDAIRGRVGG